MISYAQSFRDEVEAFLKETGIEPTRFGREALKDPRFVFDLREGRSPSGRTMDRVRDWMTAKRKALKARDTAA